MGMESFDIVIHCTSTAESVIDCLDRMGTICPQRQAGEIGIYRELVDREYIIEFQVLQDSAGVRISLRSALCCAPSVVDKMIGCAKLISDLARIDIWNVMGEHTRIKVSDINATALARRVFARRRATLLKSFGYKTIPNAALRSAECIAYIESVVESNDE
jgi:hypothetical protein